MLCVLATLYCFIVRVPWRRTHAHVCHHVFACVSWLIHMRAMTHWYACHDLYICVPWLIHMRAITHSLSFIPFAPWCVTHSYVDLTLSHLYVGHIQCVTSLHLCAMTRLWDMTLACVTWHTHKVISHAVAHSHFSKSNYHVCHVAYRIHARVMQWLWHMRAMTTSWCSNDSRIVPITIFVILRLFCKRDLTWNFDELYRAVVKIAVYMDYLRNVSCCSNHSCRFTIPLCV